MSHSSTEAANKGINSPDRMQFDARIKNLEIENRELKQQIFDHYEWCRQRQKILFTELECLRSISIEYRILDFLRRQIERSTGASRNSPELEAEKTKVSLVLAPRGSVGMISNLLHEFCEQDHKQVEVILVVDDEEQTLSGDLPRLEDLKIVRVSAGTMTSARVRLGFAKASGEILGYLDEQSWLLPSGLRSVALFFKRNPTVQITHVPSLDATSRGWMLRETPVRIDFVSAWKRLTLDLSNFFFRRKAFEIVHGVDSCLEEAWEYATILMVLRLYPSRLNPAAVRLCLRGSSQDLARKSEIEAARRRVREHLQKDFWKTEWMRQGLSHEISKLRAQSFGRPGPKLWFCSPTDLPPGNSDQYKTLPWVPRCPITEQYVDRFLFTLVGTGETEPESFGVFFHSASQLVAIERFAAKSEPLPPGDARPIGQSATQGTDDWTFPRISGLGIEARLKRIAATAERSQDLETGTAQQAYAFQLARATQQLTEFPRRVLDFPSDLLWTISWKTSFPDRAADIMVAEGWQSWVRTADFTRFCQTVLGDINTGLGDDRGLFDAIHLPAIIQTSVRPRYLVRILANLLRWNGLLVVTTPNLDSAQLELFGPAWCHWEPSQNAFVYSVQALRQLMRHCGFQEIVTKTFSIPEWTRASLGRFLGAEQGGLTAEASFSEPRNGSRQEALAVEICAEVEKPMLGDCILGVFAKLY